MTPGAIALSTDHPNGGSFLSYPKLIALLMDRGLRSDVLKTLPGGRADAVAARRIWRASTRLCEIADHHPRRTGADAGSARTRAISAPGADADVTIYAPDDDKERMFALPRYVIKAGEVVVEDGEFEGVVDWTDVARRTPIMTQTVGRRLERVVYARGLDSVRELRRRNRRTHASANCVRPGAEVGRERASQRRRSL